MGSKEQKRIITIGLLPETIKEKGNYLPRERILSTEGITRAVSAHENQHPYILDVYNKKVQDICPCLTEPHHNSIRVIEDFYQERKPREYEDVAPTLRSDRRGLKVMTASDTARSTSTPSKCTKGTSDTTATAGTPERPDTASSPTLTSWLRDFRARRSALQVSGKGSPTPEELSFLRSLGFSETKDPDIYCLRTLRVYYLMTREKLSRGSLGFLPTWGMTFNGRCLTARTSEFPRTGNACSLSEVLETDPDPKYFLSEKSMEFLNKRMIKDKDHPI